MNIIYLSQCEKLWKENRGLDRRIFRINLSCNKDKSEVVNIHIISRIYIYIYIYIERERER